MVWYVYRRETPTFHSNIGTGLPDTERHTTRDFILTTGHHLHTENGKLETVKYLNYWIPWQQMTQDIHMKLNAKSPWKKRGLFSPAKLNSNFEESYIWCWNLDTSETRKQIPEKFWNVVLEKDGEDQLDQSCEKCRSVTVSQDGEEYYTYSKYE